MYSERSIVAPHGMVTAPHALATAAGLRILQAGGNAIEAAIAAAATIAVVYPHMNSLGGDNIWLIHAAGTRQTRALLACGCAGTRGHPDAYRAAGYGDAIPRRGVLAANTVPGAVDGWWQAYSYARDALGGRVAFAELLADAIGYAADGFPVTPSQAAWTRANIGPESGPFGHLERFDGFRAAFLTGEGTAYATGERFRWPDLANTLRLVASGGREAFYQGPIAERIGTYLRAHGGLLDAADFARYTSEWVAPLTCTYREWTLCNTPAPTQGLTSLQLLNIVEQFPIAQWGDESVEYYHMMVEATKLAARDRDAYIADPAFVPVPTERLLSKEHALQHAARISLERATEPGVTSPGGSDTIWLGVVDGAGNAVSLIQSIYFDFGSGVVVPGTGVLLQNRGSAFSLDPEHPNVIAPGKRPFHTLNPAMALREGQPELVYGTMGGEGQPQTQAAVLTRILDLGRHPQAAIDAPRWLYGRTWGEDTARLLVEARVPQHVIAGLRARGHDVVLGEPWDERMGHVQAIHIIPGTGMRWGGADPRGDGLAAGY